MIIIEAPARGWTLDLKRRQNPPKVAGQNWCMRRFRALVFGFAGLVLSQALAACASTPPSAEALANNDPYEQTNRQMLKLNGKIDKYFVIPTVGVYFLLVPEPGRRGIHNLLGNLSLPTIFVNDLLQGEFSRAGKTMWRLLINSTIGLGGFLDPASKIGIAGHGEDFGQTMAVWGVGEGPYLVLPFLGPSNPRDAAGLAIDLAMDPTNQIHFKQHVWWDAGRVYFTLLDLRAQTYQTVQGIQRSSVDYYSSLRSLYRQMRAQEIRNGRSPGQGLPDF